MSKRTLILTVAGAALCAAACAQTPKTTLAQFDPAANPAGAKPTELTGSRIKRTVSADERRPATSSNLTVITREDILSSGHTSLNEFLNGPARWP